ncbi:MAG TPA: diguanylate cyclase [Nitrospiraceae bacterium]|nr:diguanylate cyclase [Nitrospiraceae bacterium]HBU05672.1 diguanylate cyclase [Nitrospiraceae bacterium]
MPLAGETKIYKTFMVSTSLTIIAVLSGIFFITTVRTRQLIDEENVLRARTLLNSIILARKWNANYDGVYVEKKKGDKPNPYLDKAEIKTIDGKVFIRKNPAQMTREISEYTEKEGLFKFHLTSLNLVNPANKPDDFETRALSLFEKGTKEASRTEEKNGITYFRYMAPLYIDKECLQCHSAQGYKTGEVRGGISITFDIENIRSKLKTNTIYAIIFGLLSISFLLGLIFLFTVRLIKKTSEIQRRFEHLAITDGLTGIFNRRHIMTRFNEEFKRTRRLKKDMGCIMIDIDRFKSINDEFGHLVGDEVLREVSARIKNSIRIYDVLGRYGGEEFLIVLPDTDFDNTKSLAERIRENVKADIFLAADMPLHIHITISSGIAHMTDGDSSIDDFIKRADEGLYKAKNSGRDRVGWI